MKPIILPHRGLVSAVKTTTAAASIGLIGGIALQTVSRQLLVITPLFIALPAINAMSGDLATIVTAHIGDPEASRGTIRKLFRALIMTVPISIAGVVSLSLFLAHVQGYALTQDFVIHYSVFIAGSFSAVVGVTVLTSVLLNKFLIGHRLNSDDVLIPVSNVLASVLVLLSIAVAAWRIF